MTRALYYGQVQTPIVRIAPDAVHPHLWRMHWPDGQVSDLANLVTDAALALAEREPGRDRRRLRWGKKSPDSPSGARTCAGTGRPPSGPVLTWKASESSRKSGLKIGTGGAS